MRTLELRLEDVGYHFEHEGWKVHIDGAPMPNDEAARKFAALEFFDRAAAGLLNTRSAEHAFKRAAEATLLRFGVRIVGLEAPETGPEPSISPDPPQPTDPEPIASQKGAGDEIRRDAAAIVDGLFKSVLGGADRLKMVQDGPPERDLGGWSRGGAAGLIEYTLRKSRRAR